MGRKNFFEILGIEFDPPERKTLVIKKAIEDWEKHLQKKLAGETIDARRDAVLEELAKEFSFTDNSSCTSYRNSCFNTCF